MAIPPVLIKISMIHPLSLTYKRQEDVWLAYLCWKPLNAPVHHLWSILIKLCEHILIKGELQSYHLCLSGIVTEGCRSSDLLLILYIDSTHRTCEQFIIPSCFDVIWWLLHLYCGCMFNACGNHSMNEFSICLCCHIIAKWLSNYKCHIRLLYLFCILNTMSKMF